MKSKNIRTYSNNEKLVEERREQIIRCAMRLFNKKGFDGTSMRDLASACKMTSANLYNYIAEKDDIIHLIMQQGDATSHEFIREADATLKSLGPEKALVRTIEQYFRLIDNSRAGVTFLYRGIAAFKEGIREGVITREADETSAFQRILEKGCREKVFAVDDTRLVADNIVSLGQMWAVKHGNFEKRYTIEDHIRLQTEGVLKQVLRKTR